MKAIRRSLGGFTFAAVIAASLVLMPAEAHAKGRADFCEALAASIEAVKALPDSPVKDLMLGYLVGTQEAYCSAG